MYFSVKSRYPKVNHVRDLKGVLEREKAALGALITLREPTKPMLTEAASAGFYESKAGSHGQCFSDRGHFFPRCLYRTPWCLLQGHEANVAKE